MMVQETKGGAFAHLFAAGVPLGGEVYLLIELVPDDVPDRELAQKANVMMEATIHFWTENVDTQSGREPIGGSGDVSQTLSLADLMGTWRETANFKVQDQPLYGHNERAAVTITFLSGSKHTYSAVGQNWSSRHSGSFRLTPLSDVPNRYHYTHLLELIPSQGDDRFLHAYKVRYGSMTNGLELKPIQGVTLHDRWNQEEFFLRK
jgi:hypothetical protein